MLAVLLTILKIIGTAILVILALVLIILLLILFVPIRYRAKASYDETCLANAGASWLLHLVSFRVDYEERLSCSLRVLGINIFRSRPEEETELDRQEELSVTGKEQTQSPEKIPRKEVVEEAKEEAREEYEEQVSFEEKTEPEERLEHPKTQLDAKEARERSSDAKILREWDKAEEVGEEMREESPIRAIRPSLQRFFRRVMDSIERMYAFIRERIRYLKEVLWAALMERKDWLVWLFTDPANVATYHLLWRQLKKLLNHIKPRKLEGDVKFGFEDPYLTGQILTAISPFYGLYGEHFTVTPVFDEAIAEGKVNLRGRVRIFTVLVVAIRMMMDKNFRYLLHKFLDA